METRKGIVVVIATVALAAGAAGTARAQPIDCEDFARIQTYRGWGPSLHYGRTVKVAYAVEECTGSWTDDAFEYSATGTATVFTGRHPAGSTIEVLPFTTEGSFTDPEGAGWPPAWWSCLTSADVLWEIHDVYTFRAGTSDGAWTLAIDVAGAKPFRWSHAGC